MVFLTKLISTVLALAMTISSFLPFPALKEESTPVYDIDHAAYSDTKNGLNASSADSVRVAENKGLFSTEEVLNDTIRFSNKALGYSFNLPKGLELVDMADASYRATFANDSTRLEVYTQALPENSSAKIYLSYSNQFLENSDDFTKTFDETHTIGTSTYHTLAWNRRSLSEIENDRNYYGLVDYVTEDEMVYSFLMTSQEEISGTTLKAIAESVEIFRATKEARDYPRFASARIDEWNEETTAFYNAYFGESAPLTWGVFEPLANGKSVESLESLESSLDYHFDILLRYTSVQPGLEYEENYVYDTLTKYWEHGSVTELTLQTRLYNASEETNAIFEILDGACDEYLREYARDVARFGHPVLFRPFNEMNGDWCNYSAYWAGRDCDIYVELYRYIYRIFEEEGANANTLWVWNPNERSFPDFPWNHVDNYYPGDEYVDIVGLTGYNTGDYYEGESWRSFNDIYAPLYAEVSAQYKQPLMITEFASASHGGDKVEWINDMFEQITHYPRVKVAVWWDGADLTANKEIARNYYLRENEEVTKAVGDNLPDIDVNQIGGNEEK